MRRTFATSLFWVPSLILVSAIFWTNYKLEQKADRLTHAIEKATMPTTTQPDPDTLRTTWTDHQGLNREVITQRYTGENNPEFVARHDALVATALESWPIEAPGGQ